MAKLKISLPEKILAVGIAASGVAAIISYIFYPADLVPDALGLWGYIDDAIAVLVISRITVAVGKILTGHKDIFKIGNPINLLTGK